MSSIRMCDKCQEVFSELDLGWQTYTATTVDEDETTGRQITRTVQMDACPNCAMVPISRKQRKIARLERAAGIEADPTADFTLPEE